MTAPCPTSNGDSAPISAPPKRGVGCAPDRTAGARSAGLPGPAIAARSRWTPTTRTPSLSKIRATPVSRWLSPPRNSGADSPAASPPPSRAASRRIPAASPRRRSRSRRRRAAFSASNSLPSSPRRIQICGNASIRSSAAPTMPIITVRGRAGSPPSRLAAGNRRRRTEWRAACLTPRRRRRRRGVGGQTHTLLPCRRAACRSPVRRPRAENRVSAALRGAPANSAATSSARSFNVPSGANSAR